MSSKRLLILSGMLACVTNVSFANGVYLGLPEMDDCVEKMAVRIEKLGEGIEATGRLAFLACLPHWTEISDKMSGELKDEIEANYIQQATRTALFQRFLSVEQ